jgi:hypothetical protein
MMRSCFLLVALAALLACPAMAQSSGSPKSPNNSPNKSAKRGEGKMLPPKENNSSNSNSSNSCAVYGPGFFKVEGSDTCVQIGGSFGIGAGGSIGGR